MIFTNGEIQEGIWKNGDFIKSEICIDQNEQTIKAEIQDNE